MSSYAEGKRAFGFCDRTGFRYPLKELVPQIVNGRDSGLKVGRDVVDQDHPQYKLGQIRAGDAQALRNPRPDKNFSESRSLAAWNPVGGGSELYGTETLGLDIKGEVGKVTVSTS
tara:strand:- start:13072 stop:13416 length:345 start_codon:yes stop_codon:yes gene_type:complete